MYVSIYPSPKLLYYSNCNKVIQSKYFVSKNVWLGIWNMYRATKKCSRVLLFDNGFYLYAFFRWGASL